MYSMISLYPQNRKIFNANIISSIMVFHCSKQMESNLLTISSISEVWILFSRLHWDKCSVCAWIQTADQSPLCMRWPTCGRQCRCCVYSTELDPLFSMFRNLAVQFCEHDSRKHGKFFITQQALAQWMQIKRVSVSKCFRVTFMYVIIEYMDNSEGN